MNSALSNINSSSFIIRKACREDLTDLVRLLGQLFSIERDFNINPTKQRKGLELLLENDTHARIWVAEQDKKIIGMVTVQLLVSTAQGTRSALIEDLIVHGPYRDMGIGRELITAVERWCINRGVSRLQLLADKTNHRGIRFYGREGWAMTKMVGLRKLI